MKWDYIHVYYEDIGDLMDRAMDLGGQGWEMVNFVYVSSDYTRDHYEAIFKRRID